MKNTAFTPELSPITTKPDVYAVVADVKIANDDTVEHDLVLHPESCENGIKPVTQSTDVNRETSLTEILPTEPLSPEQTALISDVMPFVPYMIRGLHGKTFTQEDLLQEGHLELVRAAKKFDPTLGFQFTTYATRCIRGSVLRAIRDKDRIIRPSRSVFEKNVQITEAIEAVTRKGKQQTNEAIAREANLDVSEVEKEKSKFFDAEIVSIFPDEQGHTHPQVILADATSEDAFDDVVSKMAIETMLSSLNQIEQDIIRAYFGLHPYSESISQREIGEKYAMSQSYTARRIKKILKRLRNNLQSEY